MEEEDVDLGGHFAWKDAEIGPDNPFDYSLSIGGIVLDFKDGRLAGFEVLPPAQDLIDDQLKKGSVYEPAEIEIETLEELESEDADQKTTEGDTK